MLIVLIILGIMFFMVVAFILLITATLKIEIRDLNVSMKEDYDGVRRES
ncbi:MAG: hypothetical protein FWC79_05180 [Oscillospiraceae bacterium]|nr:hypothetical protein [Oscillospiraceae bacterium]